MVNELEVANLMHEKLPGLKASSMDNNGNSYGIVKEFTDYTFNQIENKNWTGLKNCFKLASQLYHNGNMNLKTAIENIFMFKLNINLDSFEESEKLLSMLPPALKYIRNKQITSTLS